MAQIMLNDCFRKILCLITTLYNRISGYYCCIIYCCIIIYQVGSASDMISQYEEALTRFEEDDNVNEEAVSIRYEKVCRVV